jgi:CDP-glycerol glycerophosphotransferase (TagB/SpsB family)
VIVRPHPQSALSERPTIEALKAALSRFDGVEWDSSRENLAALARADVMISDFSGIIFDYAFLFGRPVLYANGDFDPRPYDSSDSGATPWKFAVLPKLGRALQRADFGRIGEVVESVLSDRGLREGIGEARDQAWQHRSEAGARAVDFIMERAKA